MTILDQITTPFGRRSMTFGMLASQYEARQTTSGKSVDKWKLFRALCEARTIFGLSDRALAVLNALLSFYPENELSEEHGLVVFPSNTQLSLRAHGIAPATLRRHLAALVESGLLIRKDSPNGKRYARRGPEGSIDEAFGFNVAALLVRADEIFAHAAQVVADRSLLRATKERLSICRRDVAKLIEIAMEEEVAGDWMMIHGMFRGIVDRIPRTPEIADLTNILEEMEMLRSEVLIRLEMRVNLQNSSANESQIERHIQYSNPESLYESEQSTETTNNEDPAIPQKRDEPALNPTKDVYPTAMTAGGAHPVGRSAAKRTVPLKSFPLALVLQACPDIVAYGYAGKVDTWRDLMAAAVVIRSMLGVSPSAYEEACDVMGPENAATVIACVMQRAGHINSAGGYLRKLTSRAERGEFAIGPMLMALARSNGMPDKRAA